MPCPCCRPKISVRRIRRSSVPWRSAIRSSEGSWVAIRPNYMLVRVGCQPKWWRRGTSHNHSLSNPLQSDAELTSTTRQPRRLSRCRTRVNSEQESQPPITGCELGRPFAHPPCEKLFVVQGHHRINVRCAVRRQEAAYGCHGDHQRGREADRQWVGW